MYEVLFLDEPIQPFFSAWGAECVPQPFDDGEIIGWILPLGWQEELNQRNIPFTVIEITVIPEQDV